MLLRIEVNGQFFVGLYWPYSKYSDGTKYSDFSGFTIMERPLYYAAVGFDLEKELEHEWDLQPYGRFNLTFKRAKGYKFRKGGLYVCEVVGEKKILDRKGYLRFKVFELKPVKEVKKFPTTISVTNGKDTLIVEIDKCEFKGEVYPIFKRLELKYQLETHASVAGLIKTEDKTIILEGKDALAPVMYDLCNGNEPYPHPRELKKWILS